MAEKYFKKRARGYDVHEVEAFITELSDKYEKNEKGLTTRLNEAEAEHRRLESEIEALGNEIERLCAEHAEQLAKKQTEYDALCSEIGERMIVADKRASDILANAEREAGLILEKARNDASLEAKAIISSANSEAKRLIDDTCRKCDELKASADEFRRRQSEMNNSLAETERRFDSALSKLREGLGDN